MSEPTIQLFLSGRPWDAVYRTAEGQVVYKAELAMPEKRDIRISRPLGGVPTNSSGKENSYGYVATIECHMRRAVRIRMGDLDVATSDYLKPDKSGFWASLSDCVFTGPDGREYVWSLGNSTKLFLKDSERTPVARLHHRTMGLIGEARPAMLEIFAAGKDMSDIIVVTCICMEILRVAKRDMA